MFNGDIAIVCSAREISSLLQMYYHEMSEVFPIRGALLIWGNFSLPYMLWKLCCLHRRVNSLKQIPSAGMRAAGGTWSIHASGACRGHQFSAGWAESGLWNDCSSLKDTTFLGRLILSDSGGTLLGYLEQ